MCQCQREGVTGSCKRVQVAHNLLESGWLSTSIRHSRQRSGPAAVHVHKELQKRDMAKGLGSSQTQLGARLGARNPKIVSEFSTSGGWGVGGWGGG